MSTAIVILIWLCLALLTGVLGGLYENDFVKWFAWGLVSFSFALLILFFLFIGDMFDRKKNSK